MNDNTDFPALDIFREIERALFADDSGTLFALSGFKAGLETALDRIGFSNDYLTAAVSNLKERGDDQKRIETESSSVSKVIKDIIWGMIELDRTTVALLDSPILQRLRYIRQNGFTYLVYPAATHVRLEHSLGVLAVVSKYIASVNASAAQPTRFAKGLAPKPISPTLALDLKHAALLHDIGHFPLSHVLEVIFESAPTSFKVGGTLVRDFEICIMSRLIDLKSHLSEKLSIAILLSPRFREFYTALRDDEWAYLRVACLVSGTPLNTNTPAYSQLISGAVDCDKVDYLLRDSAMCNVPIAIDRARLFLNSALIDCEHDTVRKLSEKGVLSLSTDLDKPALTFVLNSSGVDTIEEVAFARATLYERVYRHSVTRNAERVLSVAICNAVKDGDTVEGWDEALNSFVATDDTLMQRLVDSKSTSASALAANLRRRQLPKRAFAFSPDFYSPIVPYVSIFSNLSAFEAASTYYHEVTSKDPFHEIVQSLKERSDVFRSNDRHLGLEEKIIAEANKIAKRLRELSLSAPETCPPVFFVPLPDHSSIPNSCAIVTHEGELESSGDYSRAAQLVSAKEIGRSVGFVTCDPKWAEIVFLASQSVLYDFFGQEVGQMDLNLNFDERSAEAERTGHRPKVLRLSAMKRFFIAEDLAARRCRLNRSLLRSYRSNLSRSGYYDTKPRLAEPERLTPEIERLAKRFGEFSGQHGWRVTRETLRQFINQLVPRFRSDTKKLLESLNFLNRDKASTLLKSAIDQTVREIRNLRSSGDIHLVPLAGTSAHMMLELLKQEDRDQLRMLGLKDYRSIHEVLGVAKADDFVVFVDDNISSGTQFSAQLLSWVGRQNASPDEAVRKEDGIERLELNPNAKLLLSQLQIRLATCVGKKESESYVRQKLEFAADTLRFSGSKFGEPLSADAAQLQPQFRDYLAHVGSECLRSSRGLPVADAYCQSNALGYENSQGRAVTLWNVPTSTFTALWCPGVVDGEPWFPLFIRRGYANRLVVA